MAEPDRLQALSEIQAAIWRELARAALDRQHAWRTPVLATVGPDGPDARTVVLREVDAGANGVVVYSDARAPKVAQLGSQPQAVLVMWSPRLSWQLRLRTTVQLHTDGLAATSRWARLQTTGAASDYLTPQAPGALLDTSSPSNAAAQQRGHFAVLLAQVHAIDWLELHPQGHRRAAFDGQGARWLVP